MGKDRSKEQITEKKRKESRRTWKPRRPPRVARTGTGCFAIIRLRAGRQPRIRGSGGLGIKWACFTSKFKTVLCSTSHKNLAYYALSLKLKAINILHNTSQPNENILHPVVMERRVEE